uniref:Uncharacterized protein n=1 Tax=Corethron hystrix TaxID=216773 RepID=A0A7S1FVQ9_9STRA
MTLSEGVCNHFRIGHISSSENSLTEVDESQMLSIGVSDIGVSCSFKYEVTPGHMHGNIIASTSLPDSGLDATLALESKVWDGGRYNVPTSAYFSACDAHLLIPEDGGIEFSGSASADVMQKFSPQLATGITKAMNDLACGEKTLRKVKEYLTAEIGKMDDTVEDAIVSARGVVEDPEVGDDAAEWGEWEQWTSFLNNIGSSISQHVRIGIIPVLPTLSLAQEKPDYCSFVGQGVVGHILAATGGTGTAVLDIPLNITLAPIDGYGTAVLSLHSIEVGGLETLAAVDFSLSNPRSFIQGLAFDTLSVKMNATILVLDDDDGTLQLRENFEAEYAVSGLRLDMRTVLDYSRMRLGDVTVDQFIPIPSQQRPTRKLWHNTISSLPNGDAPLNSVALLPPVVDWKCFLDPLRGATITDLRLNATVSKVFLQLPPSANVLAHDLSNLFNNGAKEVYSSYPEFIRDGIYGALQEPARDLLNNALEDLLAGSNGSCDDDIGDVKYDIATTNKHLLLGDGGDTYFNFDQSWFLSTVRQGLDHLVGPTGAGANDFIGCLGRHLPSPDTSPGGIGLSGPYETEWDGGSLTLKNVVIMNGDSFYDFDILAPQDSHYRTFSKVGLGGCPDKSNCMQGSQTLDVSGTLDIYTKGLSITINQRSSFDALHLALGTDMRYDLTVLGKLSAQQILERPVCLLTPLESANVYGALATVASQSSETLVRIEGTFGVFEHTYTDWYGDDYNTFLTKITNGVEKVLNQYLEKAVEVAPYLCRGEEPPEKKLTIEPVLNSWKWAYFSSGIIAAGSLVIFFLQQKKTNDGKVFNNDNKKPISTSNWGNDALANEDSLLAEPLLQQVSSTTDLGSKPLHPPKMTSLIFHPTIPLFSRILLCITFFSAIVLFIISNIAIGGSVQARIEGGFPGADTFMHTLTFDNFSLITTVRDMWNAGVYPLSILILLLSGVWPFVKLLLMFYTCVAPLQICSKERRESILTWLDILGKYSLLDAYVLVLAMVAFYYHFDFGEWGKADIYVAPKPGFYCFLAATIISLTLGHIILFFHRRSVIHQKDPTRSVISNHFFVQQKICLTSLSKYMVLISIIILALLLAFGVFQECFHFEVRGAAALVLENPSPTYSLISLGLAIPSIDGHTTGLMVIKVTYFLFALVMPFLCLLLLFVCFFVPLRPKTQQLAFVLAEMTNSWAALEVFVFSMFAAFVQLEQFAQFIVGGYCGEIDAILKEVMDDHIDVCFSVKAQVMGNSWSLVLGAVLYGFLSSFLLKLLRLVLEGNNQGCKEKGVSKRSAIQKRLADGIFHRMMKLMIMQEEGKSNPQTLC